MRSLLRFLAFASAGASLSAAIPLVRAAYALYGIPASIALAVSLAIAAVAAFVAGRAAPGRPGRRVAAAQLALAGACFAAPWLLPLGLPGLAGAVLLLSAACGVAVVAFEGAEPRRLLAWATLGAALAAWGTVYVAIPTLGVRGTIYGAALVHLAAALLATRLARPAEAASPAQRSPLSAAFAAAAGGLALVAWSRGLAATLVPTAGVYASAIAAPLGLFAVGTWIGLRLARRAWAPTAGVATLFLAATALAFPIAPRTLAGPVTSAFGGPNSATYVMGILFDVLLALGPAALFAGIALAIRAGGVPYLSLLGAAIGCGSAVFLVPAVGAIPGASLAAAGVLALVAVASTPRRALVTVAGLALAATAGFFGWRQSPLPLRCKALEGTALATTWDIDAFHATAQRADGASYRTVDAIPVEGSGREWHSARGAAHLAALLAPGARTVLLVGPGRDEAKKALLAHPGLHLEEAALLRPALRAANTYDLVLHRPPNGPLFGAGCECSVEAYSAAKAALTERGLFAQEVSLRMTPLAQLQRILAGFAAAFPGGSAWFIREALVLVGGRSPVRVNLAALEEGLSVPAVYADLSAIGIYRPWDLLGGYLCDAGSLAARLEGTSPLTDDAPCDLADSDPRFPFAYVDDLAWLLERRQGVTSRVVAGTTRGERWLVSVRLERLRKGSGFSLSARLRYEKTTRTGSQQEQIDLTNESLSDATQALKLDPGDRYAWETLGAVARLLGQSPGQHAKAPPDPPAEPPSAESWRFRPSEREREVMALLDRLDTERAGMRIEALLTIESLHDASTAPLVAELTSDADPTFRASVAGTLEQLGNPAAAPALARLLADPEWNVRRSAAQALGAVGRVAEVPSLLDALGDRDATVREAAYGAIAAIAKTPVPAFSPKGSAEQRTAQVEAIRKWWERARIGR